MAISFREHRSFPRAMISEFRSRFKSGDAEMEHCSLFLPGLVRRGYQRPWAPGGHL
jgi:hypothetical protein